MRRPTNVVRPRSAVLSVRSPTMRHTSSGAALPLTIDAGSGSVSKRCRTARKVASPITMESRGARHCIREVVLTTSPATASPTCGPVPKETTASPVLTAMRTAMVGSLRRSSSIVRRICNAARTARTGSSSWAIGAPNTPITASPMNLSSVPPNRSRSLLTPAWKGTNVRRTSSGSARSERSVKPTRSTNRIVTTRRSSMIALGDSASVGSARVPHDGQNFAPSTSSPSHTRQRRPPSEVPHSRQNRALEGFWVPQE